MFKKEQARKIPWFARVGIYYKKFSELAFYLGYLEIDLYVFKERQNQ